MTTQMINDGQQSLPSTTFGADMKAMLGMGSSMPESVLSGAVNDHMSGQMSNTMSDMMNFPDQADAFKSNGVDSMVRGVDELRANDGLGMVRPDVWQGMAGFGSDMQQALGFDPSIAAGGDLSDARMAPGMVAGAGVSGMVAGSALSSDASDSNAKLAAQTGVDGMHTIAKTAGKFVETGVEAQGEVLKTEAKVAGKAMDAGEDVAEGASKALGGVADLAKSPAGKLLGKAALPLGLVGGAVALSSDADKFGDVMTDPLDGEKWGKARDALREDLPIPGAPLVIDAISDPGKILDAGKDIGKAITDPSMDNLKSASSKVLDELGFG